MGRPVQLRGPLGKLARAVGGTAALGALLGVSPRSLQRWAQTQVPRPARPLINRIAAEHNLPTPFTDAFVRERSPKRIRAQAKRDGGADRPRPRHPVQLPDALGTLARAVGGTTCLANVLGVSARTIQRWAWEGLPAKSRALLSRLAADYGLPDKAQAELAHFHARHPGLEDGKVSPRQVDRKKRDKHRAT